MADICVAKPYFRPLYVSQDHNIICFTPRESGKSFQVSFKIAEMAIKHAGHDIVVFRANANSLVSSVVNDVLEKFYMIGIGDRVRFRSAPMRIEVDCGKTNIYFIGVSGHDRSRVRGTHPEHPLSMIVGDECQQISDEENLTHALASLRRYIDTGIDYKIILCGNPHEVKGHWWNVYCQRRRNAPGYSYIAATYKDIWQHINEADREEIALLRAISPALYRFMYLGDLSGINGGAYPSFSRERHVITQEQAREMFTGQIIESIVIGGDGAIKRDMTCFNCIAIMSGGRSVVLNQFVFDPVAYGSALPPSILAEKVEEYLEDLDKQYGFRRNGTPVMLSIDCASEDLITQLRYQISDYFTVVAYTTKNVVRNVATVNNAFARDNCYIVDYGGYKDYATGKWIHRDLPLLAEQLETVVWKNSKLDPAIPNDCSDSLTYGLCTIYENPDNMIY